MRLPGRDAPQIGIGPMREPLWPADLVGSITHAADLAGAVVLPVSSGYRGVGLDIETVLGDDGAREVGGVVASADETRYLAAFEHTLGRNVPLTLLFSAKESFFKAVHGAVRRYFDFDALELERIDVAARRMHFRLCEDLGPDLPPGTRHTIHFQRPDAAHVATLCLWKRGAGHG
ncbi:MAG TPA: 4'-phosphopantetheinyl transferase superfamily protein [Duganella sp.]|nr:4'-phosphopantetheinyl transferase superfamily protein [Duganella sp.]